MQNFSMGEKQREGGGVKSVSPLLLSSSPLLSLLAPPPWEEPLFSRLCSPAHRRTLALLSAQSSLDDSSCSLASRSRSVSPLRSSQHRDLLLGLLIT